MAKNEDLLAYMIPLNIELYIPYRANKPLLDKINYIFTHPRLPTANRRLFLDISTKGSKQLLNDMAVVAIAICKHFVDNKQQYNNDMTNIEFQVLRRMWTQTFKHMRMQNRYPDTSEESSWKYIGVSLRSLTIENGFFDELLRVTLEQDYIVSNDDMVKVRKDIGLRERRLGYSYDQMEYLCGLD